MKKVKKFIETSIIALQMLLFNVISYAKENDINAIEESTIGQGGQRLVADIQKYALIIGIPICIVALLYYFIRKGMADDTEQKKWKDRIIITCLCAVGIIVAPVLINLVISYFK